MFEIFLDAGDAPATTETDADRAHGFITVILVGFFVIDVPIIRVVLIVRMGDVVIIISNCKERCVFCG
jgi:hypothetical protein